MAALRRAFIRVLDALSAWLDRQIRKDMEKNLGPVAPLQGRADAPTATLTTYIIRPGVSANERLARRAYLAEVEEMMRDISERYDTKHPEGY
jgi:hypothetical protein